MDERECGCPESHHEHIWPYDVEVWAYCSGGGR